MCTVYSMYTVSVADTVPYESITHIYHITIFVLHIYHITIFVLVRTSQ